MKRFKCDTFIIYAITIFALSSPIRVQSIGTTIAVTTTDLPTTTNLSTTIVLPTTNALPSITLDCPLGETMDGCWWQSNGKKVKMTSRYIFIKGNGLQTDDCSITITNPNPATDDGIWTCHYRALVSDSETKAVKGISVDIKGGMIVTVPIPTTTTPPTPPPPPPPPPIPSREPIIIKIPVVPPKNGAGSFQICNSYIVLAVSFIAAMGLF